MAPSRCHDWKARVSPNTTAGTGATTAMQSGCPLVPGLNHLYLYQRDIGHSVTGILFSCTITVDPEPPTAGFVGSPTTGTAPLAVQFDSSGSTGSITDWEWNFGDGTTSTIASPTHTYFTGGTYTVSLTTTGPGGSDTLTRANYIAVAHAPPSAGFTGAPTAGSAPLTVQFGSSGSTGPITDWEWTFDEGNPGSGTSTAPTPTYTYATAGVYSVKLTVTGPGGTDALTLADYITVSAPPPTANFGVNQRFALTGHETRFTNRSTGAQTYLWRFGDGETSTAVHPTHTYATPGAYDVSLTAFGSGTSDVELREDFIHVIDASGPFYVHFAKQTSATIGLPPIPNRPRYVLAGVEADMDGFGLGDPATCSELRTNAHTVRVVTTDYDDHVDPDRAGGERCQRATPMLSINEALRSPRAYPTKTREAGPPN
ncbi:MAG: PKD domain-containing protein [bacterium]|nr:PKD domain-containing protein [bacterium]